MRALAKSRSQDNSGVAANTRSSVGVGLLAASLSQIVDGSWVGHSDMAVVLPSAPRQASHGAGAAFGLDDAQLLFQGVDGGYVQASGLNQFGDSGDGRDEPFVPFGRRGATKDAR